MSLNLLTAAVVIGPLRVNKNIWQLFNLLSG